MDDRQQKVLSLIDPEEVKGLALALANIGSPPGHEAGVGNYLVDWLQQQGFAPQKVGLVPERFCVTATLPGTGDGLSLLFNSHMDTTKLFGDTLSLRNPEERIYHQAWVEGEHIYGEGVVNDKGPMAAFLVAAKAIQRAGVPLRGDLVLTMVPGEMDNEPVDEFTAPDYLSKEVGARFLVSRGAVADYVLVAEGTNFNVAWTAAGKACYKITVYGRGEYTPFLPPRAGLTSSFNAIVKMAAVVAALEEWADRYERENTVDTPGGRVIPKMNIGAIRGGNPFKVSQSSEVCSAYLDVRLAPGADPLAIRSQLRRVLSDCGVEGEVLLYTYRQAQVARGVEPLVSAIARAHTALDMEPPQGAAPVISSMWRDIIPFIEAGIPALTYGPGASTGDPHMSMRLDALITAARCYALLALDICSRIKA